MNRRVQLKRISGDKVTSPAMSEIKEMYGLDFYEGFHYIDEECLNVGRIYIAVDPEREEFAVAEEGNSKLHGWHEIEVNPQAGFYDWCFFPRELTKT